MFLYFKAKLVFLEDFFEQKNSLHFKLFCQKMFNYGFKPYIGLYP